MLEDLWESKLIFLNMELVENTIDSRKMFRFNFNTTFFIQKLPPKSNIFFLWELTIPVTHNIYVSFWSAQCRPFGGDNELCDILILSELKKFAKLNMHGTLCFQQSGFAVSGFSQPFPQIWFGRECAADAAKPLPVLGVILAENSTRF